MKGFVFIALAFFHCAKGSLIDKFYLPNSYFSMACCPPGFILEVECENPDPVNGECPGLFRFDEGENEGDGDDMCLFPGENRTGYNNGAPIKGKCPLGRYEGDCDCPDPVDGECEGSCVLRDDGEYEYCGRPSPDEDGDCPSPFRNNPFKSIAPHNDECDYPTWTNAKKGCPGILEADDAACRDPIPNTLTGECTQDFVAEMECVPDSYGLDEGEGECPYGMEFASGQCIAPTPEDGVCAGNWNATGNECEPPEPSYDYCPSPEIKFGAKGSVCPKGQAILDAEVCEEIVSLINDGELDAAMDKIGGYTIGELDYKEPNPNLKKRPQGCYIRGDGTKAGYKMKWARFNEASKTSTRVWGKTRPICLVNSHLNFELAKEGRVCKVKPGIDHMIRDSAVCEEAALEMGFEFSPKFTYKRKRPLGCFVNSMKRKVSFNTRLAGYQKGRYGKFQGLCYIKNQA